MKTAMFAVSLFSFVLVTTTQASAQAVAAKGTCESFFKSSGEARVAPVSESVKQQARAVLDAIPDAIAERGFITGKVPLEAELAAELGKRGIVWWDLRIYIAKSVEEAQAHAALEPDILMQGVYLIHKGQLAKDTSGLTEKPAPEVFETLTSSEDMYYIRGGVPEKISRDWIAKNLSPKQMDWKLDDPEHGPWVRQTGWAFPTVRGVILHADTLNSTKTWGEMRRLARKLVAQGFKVTFNKDFAQSLDLVAKQPRRVKDANNPGQYLWVVNSRYLEKEFYDATIEAFKNGRAFSVEIWNEKGELVGGLIGNREGSLYSPDSVFYDHANYPKISISFSKVALVALMDRLVAAGIPFIDAGMASPFTLSMRGKTIPSDQFLKMIEELKPGIEVDLIKCLDAVRVHFL